MKNSLGKNIFNWKILLFLALISMSTVLYTIHYLIFKDSHHIFLYLVGDIAFIPMEVLFVTLIIHKMLEKREKSEQLKKLNMIIGAFFSEVGTPLIRKISNLDQNSSEILNFLYKKDLWHKKKYTKYIREIQNYDYKIILEVEDLMNLRDMVSRMKEFQLNMLTNSNLLEHDSFTDMLWAVFHMTEELFLRDFFEKSSKNDLEHLKIDIERSYKYLVKEWFNYMNHLHSDYPYLFSLALRLNPLNPTSKVKLD